MKGWNLAVESLEALSHSWIPQEGDNNPLVSEEYEKLSNNNELVIGYINKSAWVRGQHLGLDIISRNPSLLSSTRTI